jgi:2-haloacid dehalogenase
MAMSAFGLRKEEIAFAAFGGWDAVGSKWFGYPTFWVNRVHVAAEELGSVPEGVGKDLNDLAIFVQGEALDTVDHPGPTVSRTTSSKSQE